MKEALCNALEGANKRNREYREQIARLQAQLLIATKALKKMAKDNFQCAEQALEEIELREVK